MVFRLRRFLFYGIAAAILCTVFSGIILMRSDISKTLEKKAELVVKSNKKMKEKVDPKIVESIEEENPLKIVNPGKEATIKYNRPVEEAKMEKEAEDNFDDHPDPFNAQHEGKAPSDVEKKDSPTVSIPSAEPAKVEPKEPEEPKVAVQKKELKPDTSVHIFYYPWYGSPPVDNGSWYHWNHRYLPHWDKKEADKWPQNQHRPPDDIGSNFYPKLGCYSSRDLSVIHQHMQWIRGTGVGVVAVSWYPPGQSDNEGKSWGDIMPKIMDSAQEFKLKVTVHIEPYQNRTVATLKENVAYILAKYGKHPAFYYYQHMGRNLPLFYIYDSYLIPDDDWSALLATKGVLSLRGTKLDAFYIGLLVKEADKTNLFKNGFDGFYTYFAANRFTYGSTWLNWANIRAFAKKNRLIFIPSVGPGYVDDRIRPWNKASTRPRNNGSTYEESFGSAIKSHPDMISITSFNEWHEGTQIEPAVPRTNYDDFKYLDYTPMKPDYYLNLTRSFIERWAESQGDMEVEKSQHLAAAVVQ